MGGFKEWVGLRNGWMGGWVDGWMGGWVDDMYKMTVGQGVVYAYEAYEAK